MNIFKISSNVENKSRDHKGRNFWKEQSRSLSSLILHFKCFTSVHINNHQVRYDITLCPFHQLIGCCGQMAVWCNWVVGYSEFMKPFFFSTPLHPLL